MLEEHTGKDRSEKPRTGVDVIEEDNFSQALQRDKWIGGRKEDDLFGGRNYTEKM